MRLYEQDFNTISAEDREQWEVIQDREVQYINGRPSIIRRHLRHQYPVSVRHYLSLFPNNHIDIFQFKEEKYKNSLRYFEGLIDDRDVTERDILNFINNNEAHFIIGAILKNNYRFGFNEYFIFPEFCLSTDYKVDYLLVGDNSDGYHFVFVELEKPYSNIATKNNDLGSTIRNGISQIDKWQYWLEQNFSNLETEFKKYATRDFPIEFRKFDTTRMNYAVVAGRRNDYNTAIYRQRRALLDQRKLLLLHYDNLIDNAKKII